MRSNHVWLGILVACAIPGIASAQEKSLERPERAAPSYQSNPPTYAIHLVDGRTAIVWWDARTDSARPQWKCEVPPRRDGSEASISLLKAGEGDWRGALREATTRLEGVVADGE
jgi:hypothetical protein